MVHGSVKNLLLVFVTFVLWANLEASPNVLVLDSYHPGYSWSDGELQGVLRVMGRTYPGTIPSVEYLDTNRHADKAYTAFLFEFILNKYRDQPFDVIVTLDDPALQLVLRHRAELGLHTPVVFGGVNNYEPKMLDGFTDVTGVCESFDFIGNIDLILRLRPKTKTVHVISDTAPSTSETRAAFHRAKERYEGRLEFRDISDWTAASLLKQLAALPADDSALLIGNARDANGQLVSENEEFLKAEASSAAVPVFMISQPYLPISEGYDWNRAVWYGMGGRMLTSDVHGEAVGLLVKRILDGEKAGAIPVVLVSPTRCAFHYPQLLRHKIDLARLPPEAEIFARPITAYQQYKTRILLTLLAIVLLLLVIIVLVGNIVKRRRAERDLRVAIDRFELVARATNDAVWDLDLLSGVMWWNDGYKSLLGVSQGHVANRETWLKAFHPDDRASVKERLFGDNQGALSSVTLDPRIVRADGGVRDVLLRCYFLRNAHGRPVRAVGSMLDLTQHKATERQLLLLATAVMQASEIVIVLDLTGCVEYANPAFTRSTGLSLENALRRPLDMFVDSKGLRLSFEHIAKEVADRGRWAERLSLPRQDNEVVRVQVMLSAIRQSSGSNSGYLMMGLDVTNEVRLEERVRLAQKMDAIGTLAGGVAHDFNNMLFVITGNVSLAMEDNEISEETRNNLEQIRGAANRATQLTRQLLLFGRRQPPHVGYFDLRELTAEMLKLLRPLIGENYAITQSAEEGLWGVQADKGQLEQVLMNLCVNARDAMPSGGRLSIALRNTSFDAAFCETHVWAKEGDFTCLAVADTGCGIDGPTLNRIFEPFYTTKPKDKGTGLGLSVVFGIVEQHRGFIHVESTPGLGSRFEVFLPRAGVTVAATIESRGTHAGKGCGTILMIEDEESVRTLIRRVLLGAGYEVLSASDGREGCSLGLRHLNEISLVVLDAVLPHMSGMEVYEKLAPLRLELPFLFCSGYSADVLPTDLTSLCNVARLQKPFEPQKLLQEVERYILKKSPLRGSAT